MGREVRKGGRLREGEESEGDGERVRENGVYREMEREGERREVLLREGEEGVEVERAKGMKREGARRKTERGRKRWEREIERGRDRERKGGRGRKRE